MKKIISAIALAVFASSTWSCDEQCRRDKAEATHQVKLPSYLSWKYCEDLKLDFMTREIKSLHKYRNDKLQTQHRGGMNNIRKFIGQRHEWLKECDNYVKLTEHGRLFKDKAVTGNIFKAMKSVESELASLVKGVTYSVDTGGNDVSVAEEKFDHLFQLVEAHQTHMLLRGQVVYR